VDRVFANLTTEKRKIKVEDKMPSKYSKEDI
jgi:hypothetical protein